MIDGMLANTPGLLPSVFPVRKFTGSFILVAAQPVNRFADSLPHLVIF
jgi:hypothetical protein